MSMAGRMLRHPGRQAGLTQRELSARVGIPQETIARIEAGRVDPRVGTLDRLLEGCRFGLEHMPRLGIGVDRTQIRQNLALSPSERLARALDIDDPIAVKRAANRPKDQAALQHLGALREEADRRGR